MALWIKVVKEGRRGLETSGDASRTDSSAVIKQKLTLSSKGVKAFFKLTPIFSLETEPSGKSPTCSGDPTSTRTRTLYSLRGHYPHRANEDPSSRAGIADTRIRRDIGGGILIKIPDLGGDEKADQLVEALVPALQGTAVVTRPVQKGEVRLTGSTSSWSRRTW